MAEKRRNEMERENETKRVFGDNPISRLNTFEKLTALKQPTRRDDSSKILTTPEAIVRGHREMMRRMAPGEREDIAIYGRRPERSLKRNFVRWGDLFAAVVCAGAALACLGYIAIKFIVPLLRAMILA
jgi:hypothetical protein